MAIRTIRTIGDEVLGKVCKEVTKVNDHTLELIEDMFDTMYEANGVGLAAPQVGVLKRIVVIDVTGEDPILLINPKILETDGEQTGGEGCLSVPGKSGQVTRPNYVKCQAQNEKLETFIIEGEELLARAICHELDHLDGHLYVEKVEGELSDVRPVSDDDEEEQKLKVVFMGTPDFASGALEKIIEAGHEVTLVVTQPDKPKGRSKELMPPPVKEVALAHNIPVFQPVKIKTPESVEELRKVEADIFVVAAFAQILSKEILEMPKYGCINIHASLLPKYRGAAPIQWSVLDGEPETGVTIMQMNEGLDTGDMLLQKRIPIGPKDTGESMFDKLAILGSEMVVEALEAIEKGELTPVKQEEEKSTYAKMLKKEMGKIDFHRTAKELDFFVRGMNSWPCAYTSLGGKTLKIWEAEPVSGEGTPGSILEVTKDAFLVATGEGALKITSLQLEGKKRMSTRDFLLGYPLKTGDILG